MTEPVSLGPFSGLDIFHSGTHSVFQPKEEGFTALSAIENFDLDDTGWPCVRSGLTSWVTLATEGLNAFSGAGALLIQDGGKILEVTGEETSTELVTGLSETISAKFVAHAGQIFWTNSIRAGRISGHANFNFGLTLCPRPSLTQVSGSLSAGGYLVAGEFVDSSGIIHASKGATKITLTTNKDIIVNFSSFDSNATYVRLYLAGPDDDVLYYVGDIPVGSFPYKISSLPTADTTCWTIGLSPPPKHDFAFSWQDRLMLVAGQWIYPSVGAAVHLYDIGSTIIGRPEKILAGGGLPDGFWTVSSKGAYWASGTSPEAWRQIDLKFPIRFCQGSFVTNSAALPFLGLEGSQPIVLFWSDWGLAVGLSNGNMLFPLKNRYRADVSGLIYSACYVQKADFRQIIHLLR